MPYQTWLTRIAATVILHCWRGVLQGPFPSFDITAAVCVRLAVTIRAKHSQILEAMVIPDAVNVVDMHRNRLASPVAQAALLANIFQHASLEQPPFYSPT